MDTAELKRRFGRKVKALRERAGLTQEELAEKIDRTAAAVSNIERGIHATKIEVAHKISIAVNVPLDELFVFSGAGASNRERRRELDMLVAELQGVDVRGLQAIRRLVVAAVEASSELRGKRTK